MAMTYLGNMDGFQSVATHQYSVESLSWLDDATDVSLLAGDLDGDGKQDILVVDDKKHYMMHAGIDGQLSPLLLPPFNNPFLLSPLIAPIYLIDVLKIIHINTKVDVPMGLAQKKIKLLFGVIGFF